ncbi:MAG: alpha/beta hydrolase [Limnohabitans sp.]|nr:alpha/beta hydrolase [Limnohabitans sp.]
MTHTIKKLYAMLLLTAAMAAQADVPVYGVELQGFEYPSAVLQFSFKAQGQSMHMAYLDYQPATLNGHAVVLLHGKNFCAATWHDTALLLQQAGLRVIVPDQIGFCKSAKPDNYTYSFAGLAENTRSLLKSLKIDKVTVIGHSMGGMLAARYALMYPAEVSQLVMVNPLGLEDWKALGVPALSQEQWYARELDFTDERLRNYERSTYYAGEWKDEYEPWVQMIAGMFRGPGKETIARHSALVYQMIFEQPVLHEFAQLKVPTQLMIGVKDTTALGKDLVQEPLKSQLGNYRAMSLRAVKTIPGGRLVLFPDLGHAPQMQNFERFKTALLNNLVVLEQE